jgi:hypothetical protein
MSNAGARVSDEEIMNGSSSSGVAEVFDAENSDAERYSGGFPAISHAMLRLVAIDAKHVEYTLAAGGTDR